MWQHLIISTVTLYVLPGHCTVSKYVLPVMCTVSNRHKKMFVTVLFSVTWHRPLKRKHWAKNLQEPMTLSFLFQGSMITQIMVDQINRWFHSGQGFSGSFDHPKGTHPTLRFMWQASCLLLGLCAMIKIWLVNLANTWPRCFYFLFLTWLKKTKAFQKKNVQVYFQQELNL